VTGWLRNPYLWAFVVGCTVVTLMRPLLRRIPPPPPVLGEVPAFSLVAPDGRAFGSKELRGHVYVASFFFTRCGSICPKLMEQLGRLARRYREDGFDVRVVSITVDPDHDTPERLRAAAARYGAQEPGWVLLTGSREAIRSLAVDGLKLPVGDVASGPEDAIDIAHSGKLVLVDPHGELRGYYDSTDVGLDEAYWRSRHVLDEAKSRGSLN
jgi:protein SCO1